MLLTIGKRKDNFIFGYFLKQEIVVGNISILLSLINILIFINYIPIT